MFGRKTPLTVGQVLQDPKMQALINKVLNSESEPLIDKAFYTVLQKPEYAYLHYAEEKIVELSKESYISKKYYNYPEVNLKAFKSFDWYKIDPAKERLMMIHETPFEGHVCKSRKRTSGNYTSMFIYSKSTGDKTTLNMSKYLGSPKGADVTVVDFIKDYQQTAHKMFEESKFEKV